MIKIKIRNIFSLFILIISLAILYGCAGKLTVDKKLIEQFQPAFIPEKNETLVYVIRKSQIIGATRGLYVGLNDQIISNIHSGEFCYFKMNNGINTINLEQQLPFHYYRIDNRPGEIIYLYFEMISITTGKFSELPKDLGITAVMQSEMAKDMGDPKNNNWYVSILMNPDLLNLYLMKETDIAVTPDSENALITFIRPQSYKEERAFGIWNENKFLGNLKGKTYFQIKIPAGNYTFLGKSEHFSILKAEVEAGKNYFVQVAASGGMMLPHIRLLPVTNDIKQSDIQVWLDDSKHVIIDETVISAQINERLDLALPYIKIIIHDANDGKYESRVLGKRDGR